MRYVRLPVESGHSVRLTNQQIPRVLIPPRPIRFIQQIPRVLIPPRPVRFIEQRPVICSPVLGSSIQQRPIVYLSGAEPSEVHVNQNSSEDVPREKFFESGNRKSFLKRSQIISRVHPSQNATLSDEREQVNFGEFEFRDFDDVHSEEPEAEAMDAQPQQLQQNFADPLLSNPYLQQTIITVHAVKESLSGAGLDRLLSMMGTLFQNSLVVNSKDIQREKENWVAPFRVKETVYCDGVGCKKSLPSLRTVCPCGANKNKKIILSTATIIPHVLILVKKYETELFMQRQPTSQRSDLTDYMGNCFEDGCLTLHFILNTDGVQPKQNSRKPFHPILLMLKNLKGSIRSSIYNIMLAGIIHGVKVPPQWVWDLALQPLTSDMEVLKAGIPFTRSDGSKVIIKGIITDVVVDQIASQIVYQHCSHAAYGYGCTACDIFPVRGENAQRWSLKSGNLREETGNRVGLAVVDTTFCKLAPESAVRLDGLHVLDEGLCKTLMNLLFNQFKIVEEIKNEINRTMLKYGASTLYLKCNAHEMRRLFTLTIPILFASDPKNEKFQAACLFWMLCRILYSKYLNEKMIEEIVPVFQQLGEIMKKTFGNAFKTIKGHKFFGHGGDELKKHGTPADFSAAAFECANRLLALMIDPYNTRGFDKQLIRKHLQNVMVQSKVEQMVHALNLNPESYKHLYIESTKNYVSKSVTFNGQLLPLMVPNEQAFYSVRSNGYTHHFNPTKGESAYFKATIDGDGSCYKALIGVERNKEKFFIAQKLNTFNPITSSSFAENMKATATILTKYQSIAFEMADSQNSEHILIPYKNVIGFVVLVEFKNRKFLIDESERYNKT